MATGQEIHDSQDLNCGNKKAEIYHAEQAKNAVLFATIEQHPDETKLHCVLNHRPDSCFGRRAVTSLPEADTVVPRRPVPGDLLCIASFRDDVPEVPSHIRNIESAHNFIKCDRPSLDINQPQSVKVIAGT